jgi:hypothetical protein
MSDITLGKCPAASMSVCDDAPAGLTRQLGRKLNFLGIPRSTLFRFCPECLPVEQVQHRTYALCINDRLWLKAAGASQIAHIRTGAFASPLPCLLQYIGSQLPTIFKEHQNILRDNATMHGHLIVQVLDATISGSIPLVATPADVSGEASVPRGEAITYESNSARPASSLIRLPSEAR